MSKAKDTKIKGLSTDVTGTDRRGSSRRTVIKGIGAAAGAAAIGLHAPFVHSAEKVIRFLNGEPSRESVRAMRFAAAQYEKEKGIKVQMDTIPAGKAYDKVQASIKSGRPYDIATLIFVGDVLILADEGKLVPINDLIKKYDWGPRILFPMKGNNYWYPYDYNLCWINYRQDLYTAKNLKAPGDWAGLMSNLDALQGNGENQLPHGIVHPIGSNGATNYTAFGYMWANGVKLFDDNWNVILDSARDCSQRRRISRLHDGNDQVHAAGAGAGRLGQSGRRLPDRQDFPHAGNRPSDRHHERAHAEARRQCGIVPVPVESR